MAHANAYGQDSAGNWVALDVNAVGEIVGLMAGGGLPMGQPSILTPWSYSAASGGITNTSDVTLIAAAGAGRSNYLTSLQVCNTSATATEVVVKSGSTVLWRCKVGAGITVNNGSETTHTGTYAAHTTLSMSDGASFGDIDYAAVFVINRALTPTETANMRTWLGTRGGLTL